ncbi:glycosyltransferase [Sphingomicrobium astaxanthinifaciens]|uniref:glycosyltransferase n=2 Tax=Sphingomicrobium astaxanthinifaciens TaxID=1227949 RepID=UPI003133A749
MRHPAPTVEAQAICITKDSKFSASRPIAYHRFGIALFRSLRNIASEGSHCIFHLHGGLNVHLHIIALFLRALGVRYCVSPHGAFSRRPRELPRIKRMYCHLVVKPYLEGAEFVQVYGSYDAYMIKCLRANVRLQRIPNGVPTQRSTLREFNCTRSGKVLRLGYCGRVSFQEKGLELLPCVLALLRDRGVAFEFHLIGSGEDLPRFKALIADQELCDRTVYRGPIYGDAKFKALSEIDIFFHPSHFEGMPLAPLEALGAGSRLVLSPETNLESYLNEIRGVTFVNSREPEKWAEAVIKLKDECLDYSAACQAIGGELDWSSISKKFAAAYLGEPSKQRRMHNHDIT